MSVISTIEIHFTREYNLLEIVHEFFKNNWSFGEDGFAYILSISDFDSVGWRSASLDKWSVVEKSIQQSEDSGNSPGIILFFESNNIGIEIIRQSSTVLNIGLTIDRRTVSQNVTDYTWYLENIVPILRKCGAIEAVQCEDVY